MSFSNLPVLRDFDPSTPNSEFETAGFGLFQDIRDLAIAYNAGAQDIRNNALSILQDTPTATLDALIQAKFAEVNPENSLFVDGSASAGGDGLSVATAFDNVLSAINACIAGVVNVINIEPDQVLDLGTGSEPTRDVITFSGNTSIIFRRRTTGTLNPKVRVNFTDNGTTTRSPYVLNAGRGSTLRVIFESVDLETVLNANAYPISIDGGLCRTSANGLIVLNFYASSITVDNECPIFTPYVISKGIIDVSFYAGTLFGSGNIIEDPYYHNKAIHPRSFTRDAASTAHIMSHITSAKTEILINDNTLSFLAETTV